MSTQITLELSEESFRRAEQLAKLTGKDVHEILAQTLDISLRALGTDRLASHPVHELDDTALLELVDSQMSPIQDERLSLLLNKQQSDSIEQGEQTELIALMQVYQEGLFRKAQALRIAVERGLRKTLEP